MLKRRFFLMVLTVAACAAAPGCDSPSDIAVPFLKSSMITISKHSSSPAAADVRADATGLPVLLFTMNGDPRQNQRVDTVTITLTGTGSASSVTTVRLVRDNGAGSPNVYDPGNDTQVAVGNFSGSTAQLTLAPPFTLAAGASERFFVVYGFSTVLPPTGGMSFGARIDRNSDVDAVSADTGMDAYVSGAPVEGSLFTVVGRLQVAASTPALPPAAVHAISAPGNRPALQVRLTAPDEPVTVTSITLTGAATAPALLSTLARVRLVVDANQDGQYTAGIDLVFLDDATPKTFASNTVTFAPNRPLARNVTEAWLFLLDLGTAHNNLDTYTFSIAAAADVAGSASVSLKPAITILNPDPILGNLQTVVLQGAIRISDGGQTPAGGAISASAANVLMLHLKVEEWTGIEAATLNSLQFTLTGGGTPTGSPTAAISVLSLYRDNGDASFSPGPDPLVASGAVPGSNIVLLPSLGESIPAGSSVSYYVALSFNGAAVPVSTFTLSIANADVSATGVTTSGTLTVSNGPVQGRTVAIVGTITVSAAPADASISNFARRTLANSPAALLRLSASGENAQISSIVLTQPASMTGLPAHISAIRLYADTGSTAGTFDGSDALIATASSGMTGSPPSVTVALSTPRTIAAAASEDWFVVYDLTTACPYGRTFSVQVASASAITATGAISGFQVNQSGTPTCGTRTLHGSWQQLTPTGTGPSVGLFAYGTCVDTASSTHQLIIHGGIDWNGTNFVGYDDTYALTLNSGVLVWSTLNTGGGTSDPPNIAGQACSFYTQGGSSYMLMWGGFSFAAGAYQNNAWIFSFASNSWNLVTFNGSPPTGREGPSMIFVPASGSYPARVIVYGGSNYPTSYNDIYYLTLPVSGSPTWSAVTTAGSGPSVGRQYASAHYDSSTNPARMILHGGYTDTSATNLAETYALSLPADPTATHTWSQLYVSGGPPPYVRSHMGWTIDTSANQLIVFAGLGPGTGVVQDIEAYDFGLGSAGQWNYQYPGSLSPTTIPSTRYWLREGAWDAANARCIFYGGTAGFAGLNEIWEFK